MRFLLGLFIGFSLLSYAQDSRGNISGIVNDQQGAVIAGANVLVMNTGTGTEVRLTTNANGYYEAPLLIPGSYSVTVESTGFKRTVHSDLTLALGDRLQINFQLEIGGTTESVTISGEAPMIDTSTVNTGRAISNREIMDLPVLGNNISMLSRFSPGVQVPGTTQFLIQGQVGGGSQYNIPGSVGGNEWSLDGASTNGTDRRVSIMPSPDIVDEFRIETSNFDASFGHATGLNISMSTKSGANAYHGSATYQYFNQRWNAASFFVKQNRYRQIAEANAAGDRALADDLASRPMLPAGHTNNYHWTLSGPISIPKVLDGKNKLFFFLGYSGLKNKQAARPSEINYTVPTMAMRGGDFSQLLQVDPVRYQIYDPLTTRPDPARPGHYVRSPFAGNIIPSSRIVNPMYSFYTSRMPVPNNDPTDPTKEPFNNYLATGMPNNVDYSSWNNRIDYHASERHRFFFRWLKSNFLEDAQDYTYEIEPGLMAWNEKRPSLTGAFDWTYTMSPTTVMNVTIDANTFLTQNQRLGTRKYNPTDAGLPSYMNDKCAESCVMPRVVWPGMTAWSGDMVLSTPVDPGTKGNQRGLKFNISHIRSSHSFRAGIDFRQHYRTQLQRGGLTSGNFSFNNTYLRKDEDGLNPAGNLGLNWAAFMMGFPNSMSVDTNDTFALMSPYYAWYVQDTWRVHRKLTLTLGLRVEFEQGATDRYNRAIAYFDPNLVLPISEAAEAAYARNPLAELSADQFKVRGGPVYAGRNGVDRRLWQSEVMWLPRISAAWQWDSKTVLRGGYGTYYDTLNVMNQGANQFGFSRPTDTVLTNDFGMSWRTGDPANGISPVTDPFPVRADETRFDVPFREGLGSMALAGQGLAYTPYNRVHPRVQRWRIGIQRELTGRMMIEASYWGQWADRVNPINPALNNNGVRLDALPEQYWATGNVRNNDIATDMNRQVPNPYYLGNFESLRTTDPLVYQYMSTLGTFTQPTIAKNRLLRPHSHMNGLYNNGDASGKASTHAFELNFQRRMSKGFNLNASYTRMVQNDYNILENEFDTTPTKWWASNSARPHRMTVTGIWELPFGKGRAYLQSGILNHVLGGWQVAATYEFQPGPMLGWGNLFYYGDIQDFQAEATSGTQTLDRWFNTDIAVEKVPARQPAAFHARVFPRVFDKLRADGLNQWNANLLREFKIYEGVKLQFRGDVINVQNRSQMAAPNLSPTSTLFGQITSQTSSLNRFYQIQARIQF